MGLFGIDVSLFKDEGARKLIAAITGMICLTALSITAMIITKDVMAIYTPTVNILALILSAFFGSNIIEGIKNKIGEIKLSKLKNGGQEPPKP